MPTLGRSGLAALALLAMTASSALADCQNGLGVARIVEIDATGGPIFGMITKRTREERFLGPKEVVLTFDDGPMPGVTRPILDTLDRYCTKATFFSVGKMAIAYPEQVREILRRGHTLGTHTWSHPMSLPRLKGGQARDQIESGFAAVAMAAGQPIAPFFRFPGLNDSPALIEHLEARNIATFTVDVVSNDSYISDPGRLIERTLQQLDAERGGIMLFHDIKPQTARALPTILAEIKARGYRVVHLRAKAPFVPDMAYADAVRAHVAAKNPGAMRQLVAITDVQASPAPALAASAVVASPPPSAPAAVAPEMAAAPIEAAAPDMAARGAIRRQAPESLAETSSWAAVLAEPKRQPSPPLAAAGSPSKQAPAGGETQPQAVAQATDGWPEVRRNGRIIRVQPTKPPLSDGVSDRKPAAAEPAAATAVPVAPAAEAKTTAAPLAAAGASKAPAEPKATTAAEPSTPQRPRIINAPDASVPPPAAAATLAVPPATPVEKPESNPRETPAKATAASPSADKPNAAAKAEAATVAMPVPASETAGPNDVAGAVALPTVATPTPAPASPSPGGSGVEILAGSYAAPAATGAPASQPADASATAGRFAAPEIIAGSYRQQPAAPAVPATETRRGDGTRQKRSP